MEDQQPEVIEVEAVYKEGSSQKKTKPRKPKKAKYQYGRRIAIFTKIDYLCLRLFFPCFILGGLGCLFFGIAFSENPNSILWMCVLILSAAVAGIALISFFLHFLWGFLIRRWKEKDPNYQ